MFDQRIKSVLIILGCAAAVLLARVAQLQIAEGARFRADLGKIHHRRPRQPDTVPRPLAREAPAVEDDQSGTVHGFVVAGLRRSWREILERQGFCPNLCGSTSRSE